MSDPKKLSQKVPFWADGDSLIGMAFFLIGIIVAWEGLLGLHRLWIQFQPLFPLTLPSNVSDIIANSFPIILNTLISAIASLCAVLMGSVWVFSGLADAFYGRRSKAMPGNFDNPQWVAESLVSGQPLYGRSLSISDKILVFFFPQLRHLSPVRYQIFHEALRSIWKVLFIAVAVAMVVQFMYALPGILSRHFGIRIQYSIPRPTPLYWILGLVAAVDVLIAASLVPFQRSSYGHTARTLYFDGHGTPNLFLALVEESMKLLTLKGFPVASPTRLWKETGSMARGTLVESFPKFVRARSLLAGYVCLCLVIILITAGFRSLIGFHHQVSPYADLSDFFSRHSLEYLFQIVFALGLIISGSYFSSWASKLLNIRNFRSAAAFCAITAHIPTEETAGEGTSNRMNEPASFWKVLDEVDDLFVAWAQDPRVGKIFRMEVYWAEITSESSGAREARFVINLQTSESLDRQIPQILSIAFAVNFEKRNGEPSLAKSVDATTG